MNQRAGVSTHMCKDSKAPVETKYTTKCFLANWKPGSPDAPDSHRGPRTEITKKGCYEWCYDGAQGLTSVYVICSYWSLGLQEQAWIAILFLISLVWPWPEPDCWLARAPWGIVPAPQTTKRRCDDSRFSDLLLKSQQVGAKVTSTPFLPIHWRVPTR